MTIIIAGTGGLTFPTGGQQADSAVGNNAAAFRVERSTVASLTSTSRVGILPNLKIFDLTNSFDMGNGIFTAPIKGIYHFSVRGTISTGGSGMSLACIGYSTKGAFGPEGSMLYPMGAVATAYSVISDTVLLLAGETFNATVRAIGAGSLQLDNASIAGFLVRALP